MKIVMDLVHFLRHMCDVYGIFGAAKQKQQEQSVDMQTKIINEQKIHSLLFDAVPLMVGKRGEVCMQLGLLARVGLGYWTSTGQDLPPLWVQPSTSLSPVIPVPD